MIHGQKVILDRDLAEKIENIEREQRKQGRDIGDLIIVVNRLVGEKKQLRSAIGFEVDQ